MASSSSSISVSTSTSLANHATTQGRASKKPFICTVVRRMLGIGMATCSQDSRAVYVHIKTQLDAALGSLTAAITSVSGETKETPVCPLCRCLMMRPVCLPCGHSLCKPCLVRSISPFFGDCAHCPRCRQTWPVLPPGLNDERKPTLVLQNAFMRWYPGWAECCKYREEGNRYAQEGDFPLAVYYYNKALETGTPDHRVLSNRSRAYLAMNQLSEALADTKLCCKLKPTWPKSHFRRGAVLEKLGQWEQAIAAYFLCVYFSGGTNEMIPAICQIIDQHLPDRKCSSFIQELSSRVVGLCVSKIQACAANVDGTSAPVEREIPEDLVEQSDFECVLCTGLFDKPVTVACGHSFCQDCLSRSFDHTPFCPICRSPLAESFVQYARLSGKMNVDELLESVLMKHFKAIYEEKKKQLMAESIRKLRVGLSESEVLPVFVCTMAFPSLPCPLHVFEPRYRLMIRRCMETGSRRFGMCHSTGEGSFSSYGTVLYVNTVEHTVDGRLLITTTGEKRFQVLERGKCDGYNTAKIRFIVDEPMTNQKEIAATDPDSVLPSARCGCPPRVLPQRSNVGVVVRERSPNQRCEEDRVSRAHVTQGASIDAQRQSPPTHHHQQHMYQCLNDMIYDVYLRHWHIIYSHRMYVVYSSVSDL